MKTAKNIARWALLGSMMSLTFFTANVLADDSSNNHGQLSAKDYKFVCEAVKGGTMEVNLGQIAADKGTDPAVKSFGQRMVQDHQKANQELTQLIQQKGATVPDASTKKDEKMSEHLQSLSGADFDKAYMKDMVHDHKKVVKEFQKESESGDDADLKSWVTKTLPTLQDHLRMAESTEANVSGSKSQASNQ